jgi:hypothetical protein
MGTADRFVLRQASLPTRMVISAFLISVGVGYLSALVQLHFQQAPPGEILPGSKEVRDAYSGRSGMGQIEKLVLASERLPFNGSGSMKAAFFERSSGWEGAIKKRAKAAGLDRAAAEKALRTDRFLERDALIDWLRAGALEPTYSAHPLSEALVKRLPKEPDEGLFSQDDTTKKWVVNVNKIVTMRCARCHTGNGSQGKDAAAEIDLTDYEGVAPYVQAERPGGSSLMKLAQTTHVHLLGFSMLYGLTGILLSLTSYPGWFRLVFGPLALIAQLADISCWWLARYDPIFADTIRVTGGIVGVSLLIQIAATLVDLFDRKGRIILALVTAGGLAIGGMVWMNVIGPHLAYEKANATAPNPGE